ncbi:MAG: hypothetical protein KatS3mg104_2747 [Phycisphaerae bacterium]|jgi:hypothetical protein|nr:MAG: hypothetical protein KatS3mg104_2747 [Phycisphaerae bacterium]
MRLRVISDIHTSDVDRVLSLADQIRADCAGAGQETVPLDLGLAVISPDCPDIPDVNRVFFARVAEKDSDQWFESAVEFYRARSVNLRCVTPARSAPVSEQNVLVQLLQGKGWQRTELDILRLTHAVSFQPSRDQVVSARAVIRLYESFVQTLFQGRNPHRAEAAIRKLDDPRYDVLVMIRERQIVAQAGLMTSGEVGLIEEVHSTGPQQEVLLANTIVGAIIDLCARSQLKHVFTVINPNDSTAKKFYTTLGFVKIGNETSFVFPDPDKAAYSD